MAKVPYTINVHDYICTELERIRNMIRTLDFSPLPAHVERIQYHASRMEAALFTYDEIRHWLRIHIDDMEMNDVEFREKLREEIKDAAKTNQMP